MFCCERNKDPIRPDVNDTIEFLTSVFHTGVGYSSIITARSALSALIEPINGLKLGKQPIITRYMSFIPTKIYNMESRHCTKLF